MADKITIPDVFDGYVVPYQVLQYMLMSLSEIVSNKGLIADGWNVSVEIDGSIKVSAGQGTNPYISTSSEFTYNNWSGSLATGGKLIAQRTISKENADEKGNVYSREYDMKLVVIPKTTPTPEENAIELGTIERDQTYSTITYKETAKRLMPCNDKENLWYLDNGKLKSINLTSLIELNDSSEELLQLSDKLTELESWKTKSDTEIKKITTLESQIQDLEQRVERLENP